MERVLNIGRYLFPLSFLLYVGLHLAKPDLGAAFVPDFIPFPLFVNYLTMVFIILFIISALIGKYDKLAYSLMALYVILVALLVHVPRSMGQELDAQVTDMMMNQNKELETINIFRNIMVAGALLGFAKYVARDKRLIG